MSTATKSRTLTTDDLLQPPPVSVDITAHQADMARRKAERDAKRAELMKCCNPNYAVARELEKPKYVWTVEATWYDAHHQKGIVNFHRKQNVAAQNEPDAWAEFCDAMGQWPSRRDAKVTFKRGKQLTAAQVAAQGESSAESDIPTIEFRSKEEKAWVEV